MTMTPINELKFFPGNARRGDLDVIAESLKKLGQYKPVVVNKGNKHRAYTNTILAGNHTVMAAQRLGWTEVDVHWVDLDENTAKRVVLVDNRASDKASYDVEALVDLATELPNLDATGFTRDEIDQMLEALSDTYDDPGELPGGEPDEGFGLIVECTSKDQRDTLKAQLLAEGFNVGNA